MAKHGNHGKNKGDGDVEAAVGPVETITLTPNAITSGDRMPKICFTNFPVGTFVNTQLTEPLSAGFTHSAQVINTPLGTYCDQSDSLCTLPPGEYHVESWVFDNTMPPSNGRPGPVAVLTVA